MRAIENKRVRGMIMRLLHNCYPNPLKVASISKALLSSADIINPDIAAYLDYLEGKEYICAYMSKQDERLPPEVYPQEMLVKLEWRGIDLLEGTTEDPGVDV